MRQLQLFTSGELAGMRDRSAARNYSPAGDQFRHERARHRTWGLAQRHAARLRRAHATAAEPRTPVPNADGVASQIRNPPPPGSPKAVQTQNTSDVRPDDAPGGPTAARRNAPAARPDVVLLVGGTDGGDAGGPVAPSGTFGSLNGRTSMTRRPSPCEPNMALGRTRGSVRTDRGASFQRMSRVGLTQRPDRNEAINAGHDLVAPRTAPMGTPAGRFVALGMTSRPARRFASDSAATQRIARTHPRRQPLQVPQCGGVHQGDVETTTAPAATLNPATSTCPTTPSAAPTRRQPQPQHPPPRPRQRPSDGGDRHRDRPHRRSHHNHQCNGL
ncbi:hypothetical protein GCM10009687_74900 [Asanoa iriomotensis]|uniref:Uncharacterized protein n=1 Tax=Asanoa iriomotensis TaxID=234613 RepID=A0ABQ4C7C5_9ACTN|nr:hypothetical protein Air01nite_47390 [Asanoa iriomotensis]